MRLPRNISGEQLAKLLKKFGYVLTRQSGSHMRLTTMQEGEHHVTIPDHDALRIGTLAQLLVDVAGHFKISKNELFQKLFSKIL